MSKLSRKQKILIAVLLLGFAGVKIAALLWWQKQQPALTVLSAAECNVHAGCALPNGAVVKFSNTVQAKAPFDIEVRGVAADVAEVYVSFTMQDMDMGFNRYKLLRQGDGTWRAAQIRLPRCVQNGHDYLADIHIGGKVFQAAFAAQ